MRISIVFVLTSLLAVSALAAGSLDKAKSLRLNGLLDDAKKELVEVSSDNEAEPAVKAEALLLLGEIAVDEKKLDVAKANWATLVASYPDTSFAAAAKAKLDLLEQLPATTPATLESTTNRPAGTLLVVGPSEYPWGAPQIAEALGPLAVPIEGTLADAIKAASGDPNVAGLVELRLAVDVPFESGRVVCHKPTGATVWEKVVRVTYPGGAEAIARRFVKKLASKIDGSRCP